MNYISADAGAVLLPMTSLQQWYKRPGATYLEIRLQPGADAAATQQAVARVLPQGVQVYTGQD